MLWSSAVSTLLGNFEQCARHRSAAPPSELQMREYHLEECSSSLQQTSRRSRSTEHCSGNLMLFPPSICQPAAIWFGDEEHKNGISVYENVTSCLSPASLSVGSITLWLILSVTFIPSVAESHWWVRGRLILAWLLPWDCINAVV